jgi:dihydropteroate synthase
MELIFGQKTLIMGIVNVTPDSFYDGGRYGDSVKAYDHAMKLLADGADIIDIGGESSRPGALPVQDDEERDRVCPVIERILREVPHAFISVDTVKSSVARSALECGARMINDISGMNADAQMTEVCASHNAYAVIMHMRGTPLTMQKDTGYADLVDDVVSSLRSSAERAVSAGVARSRIVVDPGIGFGKTLEQNYLLINNIASFKKIGFPVLVGLSRKSLIAGVLPAGEDRLPATIALDAVSIIHGADIIRVHDVKEHTLARDAIDMLKRVSA